MAGPAPYEGQLARAKWYGLATAGAAVVFLTPDLAGGGLVTLFAFALLLACGAQFLFHGATAVSMRLDGSRRRGFEAAVAVVLPLLLAAYNLQGVALDPLLAEIGDRLGGWTVVGIVAWSAVGWAAVGFFPEEHRVRGYLTLIGVLFLLSWLRLSGALPVSGGAVGASEMVFFLLWAACAQGAAFARLRLMGK